MFFVKKVNKAKLSRVLRIGLVLSIITLLIWLFFLYFEQKKVLAEKNHIIQSHEEKLKDSKEELDESKEQLEDFKKKFQKQNEQLNQLNSTTKKLEKDNKSKDSIIDSLNKSIDNLENSIKEINKEVESIKVTKASAIEKQKPSVQPKEKTLASRGNGQTEKVIYMESTAYTAYCNGCSGKTATGVNLRANPNAKVIAVDPSVIPLGTKVHVEGYGYAVASDTGGAIKGHKIDVFYATKSQAYQWGRRTVKVKILN